MPRKTTRTREQESGGRAAEYLASLGVVTLTTALGLALRRYLANVDMAMLFLLAVVVVAAQTRQGPALLASVLSIATFDFVFVPPTYTFHVHDAAYLLTFGVMLVVALVMSGLTGRVRQQAEEADARARTTTKLSALNRDLAGVETGPPGTGALLSTSSVPKNSAASTSASQRQGVRHKSKSFQIRYLALSAAPSAAREASALSN
jgi:K+-sensing histidine kinase KdpD